MVKKSNNSRLFKIISATIDEFKIHHKEPYNKEEVHLKKCLIRSLCVNDHFDMPTQGLLTDWLESYSISDLIYLNLFGIDIKAKTMPAPIRIDQQCHAMVALNWFLNETLGVSKDKQLHIYTGISDKSFHHSWLFNEEKNIVLEPTNVERETYFGYKVGDPFRFFTTELGNIFRLIEEKVIPESIATYFKTQFDAQFNNIAYTHQQYLQK